MEFASWPYVAHCLKIIRTCLEREKRVSTQTLIRTAASLPQPTLAVLPQQPRGTRSCWVELFVTYGVRRLIIVQPGVVGVALELAARCPSPFRVPPAGPSGEQWLWLRLDGPRAQGSPFGLSGCRSVRYGATRALLRRSGLGSAWAPLESRGGAGLGSCAGRLWG